MDVVNVLGDDFDDTLERPGWRWRRIRAGLRLRAQRIGASVYELEPGQKTFPYHFHEGNEELLLVLVGTPTLRTPEGERELAAGDMVAFLEGPVGAHQVINRSPEPVRVIIFSGIQYPWTVRHPDSGKVGIRLSPEEGIFFREDSAVDYWHGDPDAGDDGPRAPRKIT
jgi:uncharacterized cupin superfamily protein